MKLREIKTKHLHYFGDEYGRKQGEYKIWHDNGQQSVICHVRDDEFHGEYKSWNQAGELEIHTFDVNGEVIVNFLENPELYPETPEDKTYFALKFGIGDAPFIK